jgi:hypothetical protein
MNLHPSPGSAVELRIPPSSVVNGLFFSLEFSNVPSHEFLLLGLHGPGAPGVIFEGSLDVNSVASAIEVPFQLPGQELPIRTHHSIPAKTLVSHCHVVASDPIDVTAISVRLRLKDPPRETWLCDVWWITPLCILSAVMSVFLRSKSFLRVLFLRAKKWDCATNIFSNMALLRIAIGRLVEMNRAIAANTYYSIGF